MYSEYACFHQLVKKAAVNLLIICILFQCTLRSGERQKQDCYCTNILKVTENLICLLFFLTYRLLESGDYLGNIILTKKNKNKKNPSKTRINLPSKTNKISSKYVIEIKGKKTVKWVKETQRTLILSQTVFGIRKSLNTRVAITKCIFKKLL